MTLRGENERVLAARVPALVAAIAAAEVPPTHVIAQAASGAPLLTVAGVPLQHRGDPAQDGVRWARGAADRLAAAGATRAVVVGLGLGYHVEALAARFAGTIVVVEPDLAIWRVALATRDLSALLARIEIVTSIEPPVTSEPGAGDTVGAPSEARSSGTGRRPRAGERTRVLGYAPALLVPGVGPSGSLVVVAVRSFSSTFLHASSTAVMGYGLAKSWLSGRPWAVFPFYIVAVAMHATFNLFSTLADGAAQQNDTAGAAVAFLAAVSLAIIAISVVRLKLVTRRSSASR